MRMLFAILLFSSSTFADGGFQLKQTSFKEIFNNYRIGQPKPTPWAGSYFPYSDDGTAVPLNENGDVVAKGTSALKKYDTFTGQVDKPQSAEKWEILNHTCDNLKGDELAGCKGWYGHCNGWAAAAICEPEPRASIQSGSQTLSVGDQKALLSEVWLTSGSLFEGNTDKETKTGSWVRTPGAKAYDAFWDVTPRQFFLIFTNYIGVQKVGVIIDQFTGDEVWNQPIVGYRILPLRKGDITQEGSHYNVFIRMKIYWANDTYLQPGHVTKVLDVAKQTSDTKEPDEEFPHREGQPYDFEGRKLQFKLSFDGPVTMDDKGNILTAGKMVGDGIWEHQENVTKYSYTQLNYSHPDFVWFPTNPYVDYSGYGNPYIDASTVKRMLASGGTGAPPTTTPPPPSDEVQIKISKMGLDKIIQSTTGGTIGGPEVRRFVMKIARRVGVKLVIKMGSVTTDGDNYIVPIKFVSGSPKDLTDGLTALGIKINL